MIRLRGAERKEGTDVSEEEDGPAALCVHDRLLMVFVSHRPVPV